MALPTELLKWQINVHQHEIKTRQNLKSGSLVLSQELQGRPLSHKTLNHFSKSTCGTAKLYRYIVYSAGSVMYDID